MSYNNNLTTAMLDVLDNRASSVALSISNLSKEGYIPNKNKITTTNWCVMLKEVMRIMPLLTSTQQSNVEFLYNKIVKS